jgi:hypothetical protein
MGAQSPEIMAKLAAHSAGLPPAGQAPIPSGAGAGALAPPLAGAGALATPALADGSIAGTAAAFGIPLTPEMAANLAELKKRWAESAVVTARAKMAMPGMTGIPQNRNIGAQDMPLARPVNPQLAGLVNSGRVSAPLVPNVAGLRRQNLLNDVPMAGGRPGDGVLQALAGRKVVL